MNYIANKQQNDTEHHNRPQPTLTERTNINTIPATTDNKPPNQIERDKQTNQESTKLSQCQTDHYHSTNKQRTPNVGADVPTHTRTENRRAHRSENTVVLSKHPPTPPPPPSPSPHPLPLQGPSPTPPPSLSRRGGNPPQPSQPCYKKGRLALNLRRPQALIPPLPPSPIFSYKTKIFFRIC